MGLKYLLLIHLSGFPIPNKSSIIKIFSFFKKNANIMLVIMNEPKKKYSNYIKRLIYLNCIKKQFPLFILLINNNIFPETCKP